MRRGGALEEGSEEGGHIGQGVRGWSMELCNWRKVE